MSEHDQNDDLSPESVGSATVSPSEPSLDHEIEAALEAILFVSGEPVPMDRLLEVFRKKDEPAVRAAISRLKERYRPDEERPQQGVIFDEAAGGLRLVTRPDLHGHLRKYFEVSGSNRLTMAALETLAIVAYRQPITVPEIQELRGKNSAGVMKTLLERRLIRIAGRKDVVGKPFLYATTREFLLHFGLSRVEDLPPLEEFEETFGMDGAEATDQAGEDREEEVLKQLALVEDEDRDNAEDEASAVIEEQRMAAGDDEEGDGEGDEVASSAETDPPEADGTADDESSSGELRRSDEEE